MTRSPRPHHKLGKRGLVVLGGATVAVAAIAMPAAAASTSHAVPAAIASHARAATATATTTPGFVVAQKRIADTRNFAPTGPVGGLFQVQTDVPTNATVELTITATNASGPGYITAYPDGATAPYASNLNFGAGKTYSSTAVVQVGASGVVDLNVVNSQTDVIVDELGYTTPGTFVGANPKRIGDSRQSNGGGFAKAGPQLGVVTLTVPSADVPTGSGVVALNVTAVPASSGAGYVAAYTGGTTAPGTSSLNYNGGATNSNLVFVRPATNGTVSFTVANTAANLVVDLDGYAPAASSLTALTATRIADSRTGLNIAKGPLIGTHTFTVSTQDAPAGTTAVILNITAVEAAGTGYINTYPTGSPVYTSQVQFTKGQTIAQTIVVPVGPSNSVTVNVVGASSNVLVDYQGTIGQSTTG